MIIESQCISTHMHMLKAMLKIYLWFFRKIQEEEQESQKNYLERLKKDEVLARQLVHQELPSKAVVVTKQVGRVNSARPRLKATKIDGYLSRGQIATVSTVTAPKE